MFGVQRTGKTTAVVEEAKIKLRTLRQRAAERVVDSVPQRLKSRIAARGMNPAKLHGVEFLSDRKTSEIGRRLEGVRSEHRIPSVVEHCCALHAGG
ncbi:hypothetical protein D3C81_1584260 [compost metagenome]